MIRPLRRFLGLTTMERGLLARALPLVVIFRLLLWLVPYRTVQRVATSFGGGSDQRRRGERASAEAVGQAVGRAARCVPRATCLTQALATGVLLARTGHTGTLQLGVRRDPDGRFMAHAWVECEGRIVIGGPASIGYVRLTLPGSTT
jgi:hypothetical protein